MAFKDIFPSPFPVIGCVHLLPLPGAPLYTGDLSAIYERALEEAKHLVENGVDALIVENFGDAPFYPESLPPVTVAALAAVAREIVNHSDAPVGINALRNDAASGLSIAAAVDAHFIRVNIHMHAMLTDQGVIHGKSYETLRLRAALCPDVLILADINVKHASPLVVPDIAQWTEDLTKRGLADALIVTGSGTGKSIASQELHHVKAHTDLPVLIGSGMQPDALPEARKYADGAIVGSYFKKDGEARNPVDQSRVQHFMKVLRQHS